MKQRNIIVCMLFSLFGPNIIAYALLQNEPDRYIEYV